MDEFEMDGRAVDGLTGWSRSPAAADGGAAGSTVGPDRGYHHPCSAMMHLDNMGMDVQDLITFRPHPALDGEWQRWRREVLQNHKRTTEVLS